MLTQAKLIVAGVVALLVVTLSMWGYGAIGDKAVAKYVAAQEKLQAKADKLEQEKYNKLAADLETAKADRQIVTNTVQKVVDRIAEKEVYRNVCIDTEGVEIANKALEGKL